MNLSDLALHFPYPSYSLMINLFLFNLDIDPQILFNLLFYLNLLGQVTSLLSVDISYKRNKMRCYFLSYHLNKINNLLIIYPPCDKRVIRIQ